MLEIQVPQSNFDVRLGNGVLILTGQLCQNRLDTLVPSPVVRELPT